MKIWAVGKSGDRREVTIEDLWPHKGFLVLKFDGVETISDAETFRGTELQVPLAARAALDPGWTYLSDLIGCSVFDGGQEVGEITDVAFGAGEAPLLVVKGAAKMPYEIPFAEAYLTSVDIDRKQVWMRLPEGLLDVNRPVRKKKRESR